MATAISKNLSHRRLIKEKTNQLLDYQQYKPKTKKSLQQKDMENTNVLGLRNERRDHQTSINLDSSIDTSLSKRLNSKISSKRRMKAILSPTIEQQIKSSYRLPRRPRIAKFKSVEALPMYHQISPNRKASFTVKKLLKNHTTASYPKLSSIDNLEIAQQSKKVTQLQYAIPKSQTDLKQTLKKISTSKLKLKVKDPFQKRIRLDIAFQDQSLIGKKEDSMMSTVNQEQFRELLAKII